MPLRWSALSMQRPIRALQPAPYLPHPWEPVVSSYTGQNVTFVLPSGAPKGSFVQLKLPSVPISYCAAAVKFDLMSFSSSGSLIDQNSITIPSTQFKLSGLSVAEFTMSSPYYGDSNSVSFKVTAQAPIEPGSTMTIPIKEFKTVTSKSLKCQVQLGEAALEGASCDGSIDLVTVTFTNGVPALSQLSIIISGLRNPKKSTAQSFEIQLKSSSMCLFATRSQSWTVNQMAISQGLKASLSKYNLNIFSTLTIEYQPRVPVIDQGDFMMVDVPAGVSEVLSCGASEGGLSPVICTRMNSTSIKVMPTSGSLTFLNGETLKFNISFFKNSNVTTDGVLVSLRSPEGEYEKSNRTADFEFSENLAVSDSRVGFGSSWRGSNDKITFSFSIDTLLLAGTQIILDFSTAFNNTDNLTLGDTYPVLNMARVSGRQVALVLANNLDANSQIQFKLNYSNPRRQFIDSGDVKATFLDMDGVMLSQTNPVPSRVEFNCTDNCQECGQFFKTCTACNQSLTLLENATCVQIIQPKNIPLVIQKEKSTPFVCLGVAIFLSLIVLIWGCLFKRVLYWGNFLYAILRPVFLAGLLVLGFFLWQNTPPNWLMIALACILGVHVLISTLGTIVVIRAIKRATFGPHLTKNYFANQFLSSIQGQTNPEKPGCWYWFLLLLSPLMGFALMRWFYASRKGHKGFFWYHDQASFEYLKSVLQRFQMLYIFLIHISTIVVVSMSFAQSIYLFKIETLALCAFDLIVYMKAYFELNPFKISPKTMQMKHSAAGLAAAVRDGSRNADVSMMPERSLLHDQSTLEQESGYQRGETRFDEEGSIKFMHEDVVGESLAANNGLNVLLKSESQQTLSKMGNEEDEDLLFSITRNNSKTLNARLLPTFDPEVDRTLSDSTQNFMIVEGETELSFIGQKKDLYSLPSNLKRSRGQTTDDSKPSKRLWSNRKLFSKYSEGPNQLEVILEQNEGDRNSRMSSSYLLKSNTLSKSVLKQNYLDEIKSPARIKQKAPREIALTKDNTSPLPIKRSQGVGLPVNYGLKRSERLYTSKQMAQSNLRNVDRATFMIAKRKQVASGINPYGQLASDLDNRIVRDSRGEPLQFEPTQPGLLRDSKGREVILEILDKADLAKGAFRDRDGTLRRIIDQKTEDLMERGVVYDQDKIVVEVNGQNSKNIDKSLVELGDGVMLDINKQKPTLLEKGIVVRADGGFINLKAPQDIENLSKGLILDEGGVSHRLIDQTAAELKTGDIKSKRSAGATGRNETSDPRRPFKSSFRFDDSFDDDPFKQAAARDEELSAFYYNKHNPLNSNLMGLQHDPAVRIMMGPSELTHKPLPFSQGTSDFSKKLRDSSDSKPSRPSHNL